VKRTDPLWQPPMREGVSASRVVMAGGPFASLHDFLALRFPAVKDWAARLARGEVLDASGQPLSADAPCKSGMLLWYWRSPPPEPRVPFEIELLHQDEWLVVVDKPHFLPVTPGGRHLHETVLVRLKHQLGIETLAPMHRLDADTAGVLVFTVQPATRNAYQALLRERQVHKVYEAIAGWRADLLFPLTCSSRLLQSPGDRFMQMQVVAGPPNAQTWVELMGRVDRSEADRQALQRPHDPHCLPPGPLAHYRLTPSTGQKHQLRAQLSALGLPIVGDRIYPALLPQPAPDAVPDHAQPLQLLARQLSFIDPIDGRQRCFTSRRRLWLAPDS